VNTYEGQGRLVVAGGAVFIAANAYLAICFFTRTSTTIGAEGVAILAFFAAAASAIFFGLNRMRGLLYRTLFVATTVLAIAWFIMAGIGSLAV